MENQSLMPSVSSSSPPKHDQKLKSVVVAEEEKVTMNLQEQKPPQDIVSERTILERPVQRERASKIYSCRFCTKDFSCRRALAGHQNAHKNEREFHKKLKFIEAMFSEDTYRGPFGYNYEGMSSWPFMYGGGASSSSSRHYLSSTGRGVEKMKTTMFPPHHHSILNWSNTAGRHRSSTRYPLTPKKYTSHALSNDEDINLDLTLGPSKPIGGSSNSIKTNTNTLEATRGTTNLFSPVCPRVSPFNFVAGNPFDSFPGRYVPPFGNTNPCHDQFSLQGNGMGSSHPNTLFSMGMDSKSMVPPFAPPYPTSTNHCNGLVSSQENGMGSSSQVPPFAPLYPTSTNLCNDLLPLQENGLGSGRSNSLISKGENKAMVPEDDDGKDLEIRWLTKKKRS